MAFTLLVTEEFLHLKQSMLILVYYMSKPKLNGYQQRVHAIWRDKGRFNMTDQRLKDQQSQIRKKQWLTKLELEEL